MLNKQKKLLRNRLSTIIENFYLWAKNELDVIQEHISTNKERHGKILALENNLSCILKTLDKKLNKSAVASFEASRKKKRQKEEKSKNKKKQNVRLSRRNGFHPDKAIDDEDENTKSELDRDGYVDEKLTILDFKDIVLIGGKNFVYPTLTLDKKIFTQPFYV